MDVLCGRRTILISAVQTPQIRHCVDHIPSLRNCTESQKLLIIACRTASSVLPAGPEVPWINVVSIILTNWWRVVRRPTNIMTDVGNQILLMKPINPTILVLDQTWQTVGMVQVSQDFTFDCVLLASGYSPGTGDLLLTTNLEQYVHRKRITSTINMLHTLDKRQERGWWPSTCTSAPEPDCTLPRRPARLEKYLRDRHFWYQWWPESPTSQKCKRVGNARFVFWKCVLLWCRQPRRFVFYATTAYRYCGSCGLRRVLPRICCSKRIGKHPQT